MKTIRACIFDLDGVIVDSAKYHYLAWKQLADNLGIKFSLSDNERLKGVSRVESLNIILEIGNKQLNEIEKENACISKNEKFNEYIDQMTPAEILPGVIDFFNDLKSNNIKIALGSASRNANKILTKIGMLSMFDEIVDGTHVQNAKPNPEIFLMGANLLSVEPHECVVFEDAEAGVEAANRGKMHCVGIGDPSILGNANFCIQSFQNFTFQKLLEML